MCASFVLLLMAQWTPAEQMKIVTVGDVVPSPNARWAAWTQTRAVIDTDKSEQRTHIWVGPIDGSRRRQLTRGDKSANSPQWSPDSQQLYFASDRDGKRQIYRIAIAGGEAEKITNLPDGFSSYQLSPDGKWLAIVAVPADADRERRVREKRDFTVVDENPRNGILWVTSAEGKGELKKLTTGAENVGGLDWSPDSRRIAFEIRPNPDADDARKSDIAEVVVESGAVTRLVATGATEGQPRYSPDGRYLAFVRNTNAKRLNGSRVALLTRASGDVRELPATENETPLLMDWLPDSTGMLIFEPRKTRSAVYRMPVDGPPTVLYTPPRGVFSAPKMSADGSVLCSSYQTPEQAPEAYSLSISPPAAMKLSNANEAAPKHTLGATKVISWKSKDGLEVEGVLTLPVGYEAGKRYPLVLNIHGGPAGVFGENYIAGPGLYPIASFAAKGWAVLRPNPRGSTAYGNKFQAGVFKEWGTLDFADIMTGVDKVIADGIADPDKMAVMGWSYGGYMTFWTVTQTTRFRAAAAGAGLTNLISMWGTNDIPSVLDDYFDGSPWQTPQLYIDRSPLYHVGKATTPLLVLHGANDPRVPPSQGMEFYSALKRRGVETQMVTYPRTQHGPQEPKFVQNIMERHIGWVEKHLQ